MWPLSFQLTKADQYRTTAIGYFEDAHPALQPIRSGPLTLRVCGFTKRCWNIWKTSWLKGSGTTRPPLLSCHTCILISLKFFVTSNNSLLAAYLAPHEKPNRRHSTLSIFMHESTPNTTVMQAQHAPSSSKCHMWSACVLGTIRGIGFPGKT